MVLSLLLLFTPRTAAMAVFLVLNLGYYVACEHHRGQTVGQRAIGLHVVGPTGARPTHSQALRRHLLDAWPLGYAVPLAGAYLGPLAVVAALAGALVIAVELDRAAGATPWHDRLATTRVLRSR